MSDELKDKVEGTVKEHVGGMTGDHSTEAEGVAQRAKGDVEEGARKVGGAIEETAGKVTGDPEKEAEGEARQA